MPDTAEAEGAARTPEDTAAEASGPPLAPAPPLSSDGIASKTLAGVMFGTACEAAVNRLQAMRGQYRRRLQTPMLFYPLVALHLAIALFFALYPFLERSRRWDGWFMAAGALVLSHWLVCYGECALSAVEKVLFYSDYRFGSAPEHHWLIDLAPPRALLASVALAMCAWGVAQLLVLTRNLEIRPGGDGNAWGTIALSLRFGSFAHVRAHVQA